MKDCTWHREYLTDLRESSDCTTKKAVKEPKVDDIVIVYSSVFYCTLFTEKKTT